ncbi:CoA-binding protein [Teichococcus aestuarii]|uniref:CoA-binding protein n=1 Tax=Teichococcus aestuarii TaxID=568898 RepID=UPI00360F7D7E
MPDTTATPPGQVLPMETLSALLDPRTVAVIGASDEAARIGGRPIDYMTRLGFQGRILPVNPKRKVVQGLTAYESVAALPETPDVAIIAVPASAAAQAVAQLAERGTKAAIMFSAGFAEMGGEGWRRRRPCWPAPAATACACSALTAWACSTSAAASSAPSPPAWSAARRCRAPSASPASPAPMACTCSARRATTGSAFPAW